MNARRSDVIPCAVALMGLGGFSSLSTAQTPSFDLIPVNGSRVYSLSADGSVGAGWTSPSGVGFTWTRAGGVVSITDPPGGVSSVYAVSGDGLTVGGARFTQSDGSVHAFTWRGPGTLRDLGTVPGIPRSTVRGLNGDGSVAVGNAEPAQMGGPIRAFYWSDATGMVNLGTTRPGHTRSVANDVSRDGRVVVGTSDNGATTDAFTWTLAGGFQVLTPLPGSPDGFTRAGKMNFDGSIVVGESGAGPTFCMWRNGNAIDLGLPANSSGGAGVVNDDGTVVVGYMQTPSGEGPAVWTPTRGTEFLSEYFAVNGLSIPEGWSLAGVYDLSSDGTTFAGYATSLTTGNVQGFVATVPAPAGVVMLCTIALASNRRRRA